MYQRFLWDKTLIGYYRFEEGGSLGGQYNDRLLGKLVKGLNSPNLPQLVADSGSNLICDPVTTYVSLPTGTFSTDWIELEDFEYTQWYFEYTLSMWMKKDADGAPEVNTMPNRGKTGYFFLLEEVFGLWFDTPSSFRVHVFAEKNYGDVDT